MDETKKRVQELRAMQEQISDLEKQITTLVQMSYEIVPLKKRGEVTQVPCRVKCLCTYRQPEVSRPFWILFSNTGNIVQHNCTG